MYVLEKPIEDLRSKVDVGESVVLESSLLLIFCNLSVFSGDRVSERIIYLLLLIIINMPSIRLTPTNNNVKKLRADSKHPLHSWKLVGLRAVYNAHLQPTIRSFLLCSSHNILSYWGTERKSRKLNLAYSIHLSGGKLTIRGKYEHI